MDYKTIKLKLQRCFYCYTCKCSEINFLHMVQCSIVIPKHNQISKMYRYGLLSPPARGAIWHHFQSPVQAISRQLWASSHHLSWTCGSSERTSLSSCVQLDHREHLPQHRPYSSPIIVIDTGSILPASGLLGTSRDQLGSFRLQAMVLHTAFSSGG